MTTPARTLTSLFVLMLACSCGAGGGAGGAEEPAPVAADEAVAGVHVFPHDRRVSHNIDTDAQLASVAAWGEDIYVVWEDGREDGTNVFFNRSQDGGATWQTTDTRIDHAPKTPLSAMVPEVACEGDLVVVVWEDDRDGLRDVFLNRSEDRGVTWLPHDIRLDTDLPGAADSREPQIAIEERAVYVTWTDSRSGSFAVHFSASMDGGRSWPISDRRIDVKPAATIKSLVPYLTVRGSHVFVDWVDDRNGPGTWFADVYGRMSPDGGRHWSEPARVNTNAPGSVYIHMGVRDLARAGEATVFTVWADDRMSTTGNYAMNVYFNRSRDGGVTWGRHDVDLTQQPGTTATIFGYGMAAWEEHVCVAWQRELAPGVFTIRARRSDDAGSSWSPAPESVLSSSAIASRVLGPEVATAGEYAFVVWVDDRAVVSHDVYLNLAPWSGPFAAADIRLNVPPAGATSAGYLDIATSERAAYVVWNDDRDGYEAVYLNTVRP